VRFEYDAPSPIDIVADGSSVAVRDRKLATQDIYPLSQTPLRYLLSDRIDLLKDTNVVNVTADDVFVSVTIEEKAGADRHQPPDADDRAKDGQLKQWTVTDPQGYDTTVAVYQSGFYQEARSRPVQDRLYNYGTRPASSRTWTAIRSQASPFISFMPALCRASTSLTTAK